MPMARTRARGGLAEGNLVKISLPHSAQFERMKWRAENYLTDNPVINN
jgi:hypothetical protein